MRLTAIAALMGASIILILPRLPSWWILLCLIIASLSLWLRFKHRFFYGLFIVNLVFSYAVWHAQQRLSLNLPKLLENKPMLVQGTITSIPENDKLHSNFIFLVNQWNHQKIIARRVKLNWYGHYPTLHIGDQWQLLVKLKRIHGFANPGNFDYEQYALQQNLHANGYVRKSKQNRLLTSHWYRYPIGRIREKLVEHIQTALKGSPYIAMITALVVGIKSGIQAPQWQILQRTGTNHLMVIAGLHIGMISGLAFLIINLLWRYSRRLVLIMPTQQAAAIAALLTAFFYSALAGFSIPTQRAVIMIAVFMSSIIFRRHLSLGLGLAVALLIVLLIHPLAVMSVGFWLSFAAVSIIFYGMSARINAKGLWWKWGRLQFVVSLGLIPFTLLLFQNASIISPIANSIAIPIVGFIVVPLSLLASVLSFIYSPIANSLFHCAAWVLGIVWHILNWFAMRPLVSWQQAIPCWWSLPTALFGIMLLLAPRGFPCRWLGVICCLPLFLIKPMAPKMGTVKFTLLDVGQGLSAVVQTAHHVLVFDTGAKFSANFDLGAAVVVPFLRSQGIRKVDMLVISHGDNDHIGGANAVLKSLIVDKIVTSVPKKFKRKAYPCLKGQHWQWDGVKFRFLYPPRNRLDTGNNGSCVLRVSVGSKHLLLTGDIEKPAEKYLLKHAKKYLPAQIIIAPHHGSKTSSSHTFVIAVDPKFVFYPLGYLNRFHFPSQQVLKRYQQIGAKAFTTDSSGSISVILANNRSIKPLAYRKNEPKFWRQ